MNKTALILSVSLVTCIIVGLFAYQQGLSDSTVNAETPDRYNEGFATGDSQGYNRGLSAGQSSGFEQGYTAGYANGTADAPKPSQTPDRYDEGYNAGVSSGKTQGYNEGVSAGKTQGYTEGYNVGYINGTKDGAGSGYNIRNPTYQEIKAFLAADTTDLNTYNADNYTCYEYTRDVCNNAFNQGYRAGDVYIEFPDGAHALVCFQTVDHGLIFIEPQSDSEMTVVVGVHYWDRTVYSDPGYDDTIVKFGIIW